MKQHKHIHTYNNKHIQHIYNTPIIYITNTSTGPSSTRAS